MLKCARKKILTIGLSIALAVSAIPMQFVVSAASEFVVKSGVLVDYNGTENKIAIPANVQVVNANAFERLSVKGKTFSLYFHDNVKTLTGSFAEQDALLEVYFNDNLNIENESGLFENCYNLETVYLPKTANLGDKMFKNCAELIDLNISKNITEVGDSCFEGCKRLQKIILPKTVTRIGNNAFWNCKMLRTISMPTTVKELGAGAFYNCERLRDVFIPKGIKKIGEATFFNCDTAFGYGTLKIPEGVTHIGTMALAGLEVAKITIPKTVVNLGSTDKPKGTATAFKFLDTDYNNDKPYERYTSYPSLRNLKSISVAKDNPKYYSSDGVLYNKSKTQLLQYPEAKSKEKYSVKSSVTLIARGAFAGTSIPEVSLPQGLKTIEAGAFTNSQLCRISIPTSVEKVSEKIWKDDTSYFPTFEGDKGTVKIVAKKGSAAYKYCKSHKQAYSEELIYIESGKKPSKVTKLTVADLGEDYISLKWNNIKSAVGYAVYVKKTNGKYEKLKDSYRNSNTIYDLTSSKTYTFKVRAFSYTTKGKRVYGDYSKEIKVCTVPSGVDNLKLKSISKGEIKATWKKVSRASGYQITCATDSKFTKDKKTAYISGNKSYKNTISNLKSGKTYYIKVRAYKTVSGKKYYGDAATAKIKVK